MPYIEHLPPPQLFRPQASHHLIETPQGPVVCLMPKYVDTSTQAQLLKLNPWNPTQTQDLPNSHGLRDAFGPHRLVHLTPDAPLIIKPIRNLSLLGLKRLPDFYTYLPPTKLPYHHALEAAANFAATSVHQQLAIAQELHQVQQSGALGQTTIELPQAFWINPHGERLAAYPYFRNLVNYHTISYMEDCLIGFGPVTPKTFEAFIARYKEQFDADISGEELTSILALLKDHRSHVTPQTAASLNRHYIHDEQRIYLKLQSSGILPLDFELGYQVDLSSGRPKPRPVVLDTEFYLASWQTPQGMPADDNFMSIRQFRPGDQ